MPTFPEQDPLIGREFALNGELQQVFPSPSVVLLVLLVSTKSSQFPELCPRAGSLPFSSGPLRSLDGGQLLCPAGGDCWKKILIWGFIHIRLRILPHYTVELQCV